MKLHSIRLRHAQHFSDLKIDFNAQTQPISLILGNQAAGKTTILKNIYQALTWFPARLKDLRTSGVVMLDNEIMLGHAQSKIEISIDYPSELGHLPEVATVLDDQVVEYQCAWSLYKTLNANGIGISKVETQALEHLVARYQDALKQDPLFGLPMIAYYPTDRFVNEMNLMSKNNPNVFQHHSAYELTPLPYTTFARFFEWFREISDIENAQAAQMFQQLLQQSKISMQALLAENKPTETTLNEELLHNKNQLHSPTLSTLRHAIHSIIPEITDLYLEYHPKLQLMVKYADQTVLFSQLSNSIKNWVALVGDIVRRLSLLNPQSLFPCLEGEGILIIDNIDTQLDVSHAQQILQRLHQAFPRLQIIASSSQDAILEHAEQFHCLHIRQRKIDTIDLQQHQQALQQIYQDILQQTTAQDIANPVLAEQQQPDEQLEKLLQQIQQLAPQQQAYLMERLSDDDQRSSERL